MQETSFSGADQRQIYSVSEINGEIRQLLESNYPRIWVEGELSNFTAPRSGHWYLTLKDPSAQISCAMFKNRNRLVQFQPKDGDKIQVCGRLSLYEGRGNYQLIVDHMRPAGTGQLQLAFEKLKQQLQAEGLFDPALKKPLPEKPSHIALITSPTGAAVRDMLHTFKRRFPAIELTVIPVAVQGEAAAAQIANAIAKANSISKNTATAFDAIIVGRGGGSLEDLWAFNEEIVARAIFASELPIVSAVGHETDFSISDFVADVRAPTPTAAAEYLSPEKNHYLQQLSFLQNRCTRLIQHQLLVAQQQIKTLRHQLTHPGQKIDQQKLQLDLIEQKLSANIQKQLTEKQYAFQTLKQDFASNNPLFIVQEARFELSSLQDRVNNRQLSLLNEKQQQLAQLAHLLNAVSPLATLERGFTISRDKQGTILRSTGSLQKGDSLQTEFLDAIVESTVSSITAKTGQ